MNNITDSSESFESKTGKHVRLFGSKEPWYHNKKKEYPVIKPQNIPQKIPQNNNYKQYAIYFLIFIIILLVVTIYYDI